MGKEVQMNKELVFSWLKVFGASVLTAFLTILTATQALPTSAEAWTGILIAGLVAVIPVIINWLNPNDTRYGRGSE